MTGWIQTTGRCDKGSWRKQCWHIRRIDLRSRTLGSIFAATVVISAACAYGDPAARSPDNTATVVDKQQPKGVAPLAQAAASGAQATASGLSPTLALLDARAGEFEDQKDVKCWTSFKLLETFIAGCQLAPSATHLKTTVVLNYLDQVWARADREADGQAPIDGARFKRVAQQAAPWQCDVLFEYRLVISDRTVRLRYQDVQNFLGTIEPIRQLRSLASHLLATEPERNGLTSSAIDEASHLAALLNTLVLAEANDVARENRHETIEDDDVLQADRRIAKSLGLKPSDPDQIKPTAVAASEQPDDGFDAMKRLIAQKIGSLETFNTAYSRRQLDRTFVADLNSHEAQWARLPLDAEAADTYKTADLVDLAEFLYVRCARENPQSQQLTGAEMLATIQRYYPSVSHFEHGTIHLYPGEQRIEGLQVEEYEADAFRDSAWHWRAIDRMLGRLAARQRELPSMDHYALEELSEFVSVFAVAYVKLSGQIARTQLAGTEVATPQLGQQSEPIGRRAFKLARRQFVLASQDHLKSLQAVEVASSPSADADDLQGYSSARASLAAAYVENFFSDVTPSTGVDFRHESSPLVEDRRFATAGDSPQDIASYVARGKHLREQGYAAKIPNHSLGIEGGGVAVGDIDGDGLVDIYLVSGGRDRLYRNLGALRFEDVSSQVDMHNDGEGRGAYFIDYDNDGDQDLFVTQVHSPNCLLQNQGSGVFADVTTAAGLPLQEQAVSHSATWFDFDNDGFLDVYIGNYGDWLGDELPLVQANSRNGQPNQLLRNTGRGRFEDVTSRTGSGDVGWAQAVSHFDFNRDGWQDLYLANDFGQDLMLINDRGQRFESQVVGKGQYLHGMSVGFTDVNDDQAEDVYVSNISTFSFASKYIKPDADTRIAVSRRTTSDMRMIENNMFLVSDVNGYRERHHDYFDRSRNGAGWAWDADFFDFDNDGQEDLYIANGREPNLSYAQERNVLYKQQEGRFYDVSEGSGADFKSNARGAVHADLDGDGDLDLVVNNYKASAVVLRNNLQRGNWIRIRLQGSTSNRDAIGARVAINTTAGRQTRTVRGGSGFLSKEDHAVHFGLQELRQVDRVEVIWPSGRKQSVNHLRANQEHLIVEPAAG